MEKLKLGLLQPDLHWENMEANLDMLEGMIGKLPGDVDLLLLPETFSTGFTMQAAQYAEEEDGPAQLWMQRIAAGRNAHIAGSMIYRDDKGGIYNRLFLVSPEGGKVYYNKRHLFRPGGEKEHFTAGNERKIFELNSLRILPQVCYDLRFPVFARNRNDYDMILYLANWPASRQSVWDTLTRARAMENQSFVVGVNRVGRDGTGTESSGGSCVIDPLGEILVKMDHHAGTESIEVDINYPGRFRKKFPAWKDADNFRLI